MLIVEKSKGSEELDEQITQELKEASSSNQSEAVARSLKVFEKVLAQKKELRNQKIVK